MITIIIVSIVIVVGVIIIIVIILIVFVGIFWFLDFVEDGISELWIFENYENVSQ